MPSTKLWFYIIACVLSCVQMGVYISFKIKKKGVAYTVSKCVGSVLFIAVAAAAQFFGKSDSYSLLILIAMIISGVGDYFLSLQNGHHRLKLGAASFASAHICFIAAFICASGFMWPTLPIIAAVFVLEYLVARLIKLNCRGAGKLVAIYCFTVTSMAVLGVSQLFGVMPKAAAVMTAVGGVLFLISDMLWMMYGFVGGSTKKWQKALNVLTYFPAQMLIAGALLFR